MFLSFVFEQFSKLLESDLPIPVCVQLLHQGVRLLLVHPGPQLAQLTGCDVPAIVSVNCLNIY